MEKLTYKKFEREINEMGYQISPDWKSFVCVINNEDRVIARISKTSYKSLSLDWNRFEALTDIEKEIIGNLCWQLASTPLKDREEPKRCYLKVCHRYMPFFHDEFAYLNIERKGKKKWINSKEDTAFNKTIFTEEEFEELREEYDLSMFERVEVEDE